MAVATCGILFAGIGAASADTGNEGDNIPVLSNINTLNWDDSPFCGIQLRPRTASRRRPVR
ncbi:hypothetical protein ACN6LA_003734 [Streptomyces sp. SAS_269]|uniref:hypothetical protein n=1 Tax=Streptomyces sp. SAS_269 TaxID=3412749 RepID=UPI00403CC0F6